MVRKRSYKQESDDSDDDSDYSPDQDESQPKQYSLRKRTRTSFFEEFDYDVDSDLSPRQQASDDDDFEVDEQGGGPYVGPYLSYSQSLAGTEIPNNSQADNGLIDFEDMIRADIVINKNHVNHNSSPETKQTTNETTKKRRGRPPKRKMSEVEEFDPMSHSILGPLADEYLIQEGDFGNILEPVTQVESEDVQNGNTEIAEIENGSEPNPQVEGVLESTDVNPAELSNNSELIESESIVAQFNGETGAMTKSVPSEELLAETNSSIPCESTTETEEISCKTPELPETNEIGKASEVTLIQLDDDKTDDVIILDDKPDVIVLDD